MLIFTGIRTIRVTFNFTIAFLILHVPVAFFLIQNSLLFGIPSGDFQLKNCSADVALSPNHLAVIRVIISYLKK